MRRQNFQTISWFYDLYNRDLLDLDPPYQRRSVWNQAFRDYFIDTIVLGYPAPAIFLYEQIAESGIASYHLVDGKQRLMAIFEFIKGHYPVSESAVITELRGKFFDELSSEMKNNIWSYTFSVEYLPTIDESIINNIFDRINRNVARLTSQELRHAKYSGKFIAFAEDLSDFLYENLEPNFPRIAHQSKKQMKDVELVAQLLLLIEDGPKGYNSDELNEAFSERDTEWENGEEVVAMFKQTIKILHGVLVVDEDSQMVRSRFRNQADFYSLYGALVEIQRENSPPSAEKLINCLKSFLSIIEDETRRNEHAEITQYYDYTRTASNRTKARKERVRIMREYITTFSW